MLEFKIPVLISSASRLIFIFIVKGLVIGAA